MNAAGDRAVLRVASRDNDLIRQLRRLAAHNTDYRKFGQFWIEGDHLCSAALHRKLTPAVSVFAESYFPTIPAALLQAGERTVVVPDALFNEISGLETAGRVGFLMNLPDLAMPQSGAPTVVLDRVQDAGNVGSILRSAAAFGFRQVLSLKGSAALWSPKVLRSGMGAHFGLQLVEGLVASDLETIGVPLIVTSSHQGVPLQDQHFPWPCCWAFGHEGQGLCQELLGRADIAARIDQPGGEESLNVAAAAAICLHASVTARSPQTS